MKSTIGDNYDSGQLTASSRWQAAGMAKSEFCLSFLHILPTCAPKCADVQHCSPQAQIARLT